MAEGDVRSSDDPGFGGAPEVGDPAESDSGKGRKRPLWLAALAALVTLLAVYGAYSRQSSDVPGADSPESPAGLFQQSQAAGTSLTAVGRAIGLAEPCTAWLLDAGAPGESGAYAVTSARCIGHTDPATVVAGQDLQDASVEFNAFAPVTAAKQADLVNAPIEAVEWASVRGTDLAVLRLGTTYGELAARGVSPIAPAAALEKGSQILVAGVPVEGIEPNQQFLRGSRCQVGETSDALEEGLLWHDVQASDCVGILGGSAGSPVFEPAGAAVAMVTTTTIGTKQESPCALGLPCQVADDGGVSVKDDTNYMVPVGVLAGCFPNGAFSLGAQCPLEDPASVVPARSVSAVAKPGSTVQVRLAGELPAGLSSTAAIGVKQGRLGTVDCRDPELWLSAEQAAAKAAADAGVSGDALAAGQGSVSASADPGSPNLVGAAVPGALVPPGSWVYPVLLPTDEGFTLVCVGSAAQHTEIVIEADGTAPDPATIELTTTPVEGGVRVEPVFNPPELSEFRWVSGPVDSIDCATAEGFVEYRRVPATIQAADLPSAVCVIGIDEAGNESKPAAITVE